MNLDYDPAPRLPVSPGERVVLLLASVGFLALIAADLAQGMSPRKLSAFFVLAFWGPLLVLHELSHALAARAVGWRVSEIGLGFGRELTRFQLGQTRVRISALPLEGYVLATPGDTERARLKQALIYAAGPGSQLLLVGIVAWALGFRWPATSDSIGQIALGSLGLSAALGAASTLLPYRTRGHASDGLGMVGSFFTSDDHFLRRLVWPQLSEARRLILREQIGAAEQCVKRALERFANEPRLCGLAAVCEAAAGRPSEAYAALEVLGPPEKREPAERAELLIDAAWSVLLGADHELYSEAQRALQTALELVGDDPHALVLLGRTHLEQARPEQAYTYLMAAYKRVRDVDQEAQCVAYLAIACAELRDSPAAARIAGYAPRFFHAARSHQVPPALLERVQRAEARR